MKHMSHVGLSRLACPCLVCIYICGHAGSRKRTNQQCTWGPPSPNPPCQILAGAHLHFKLLLNICHHSVHGPITEEKGGSCWTRDIMKLHFIMWPMDFICPSSIKHDDDDHNIHKYIYEMKGWIYHIWDERVLYDIMCDYTIQIYIRGGCSFVDDVI